MAKKAKKRTKSAKPVVEEYCEASKCMLIQWGKLHVRDGQPACPRCGEPAEQILSFFGTPGWAHASKQKGGDA